MKRGIAEALGQIAAEPDKSERITALRVAAQPQQCGVTLLNVLKAAFDPAVVWDLPKGSPPFKKNPFDDQEGMLYSEWRRMYLFIKGANPVKLKPLRQEQLFVQLLEALTPADAELMLAVKEKKLPYKNITKALVLEAFPGLWTEKQKEAKKKDVEVTAQA